MKTYNVMFRATVDCSMFVTLDDDEELCADTFQRYVEEDCRDGAKIDDWVEYVCKPKIEIDDWEEA